jgi:hypothetical protein
LAKKESGTTMERAISSNLGSPNLGSPNSEIGLRSSASSAYPGNEAHSSGVSWSAVIAGGFVTAALALILIALGTGLGLSSISLWSSTGSTVAKIGVAAIVWMIFTHLASSAMGGYLAGRLRTKWANIHTDEVYFRDTAHGFLSWSVAVVVTAGFLASAAASMMGTSTPIEGAGGASAMHSEGPATAASTYFVDMLFRSDNPKPDASYASERNEAAVIFTASLKQAELSADDKSYVDKLVMAQTGLSQGDADKRVSDTFDKAREAAETTRKTLAHTLLWAFIALLIGAFCASFAATIGGRQRDHVVIL